MAIAIFVPSRPPKGCRSEATASLWNLFEKLIEVMITDQREVIILVENRIFSKGIIKRSDGNPLIIILL
jgi:hypothetical protein